MPGFSKALFPSSLSSPRCPSSTFPGCCWWVKCEVDLGSKSGFATAKETGLWGEVWGNQAPAPRVFSQDTCNSSIDKLGRDVRSVVHQGSSLETRSPGLLLGAGCVGILCLVGVHHCLCSLATGSHSEQFWSSEDPPEAQVPRCQLRASLGRRAFLGPKSQVCCDNSLLHGDIVLSPSTVPFGSSRPHCFRVLAFGNSQTSPPNPGTFLLPSLCFTFAPQSLYRRDVHALPQHLGGRFHTSPHSI